ncbi:MAG: M23 family peptidase, partial [Pyrinomonadaceae bacterium]
MRKLFLLAFAALLLFTLLTDQARVPAGARAVLGSVTLPFKVAMLYARAPDQALVLPVDGVRIKQIADTWHAPRSGGRLHEGQDIFAKRGTPVRSATE